nr:metalloregulator ArsR/SmtB family transcription factor [Nonomuraea fuscirosea]
MPRAEAEEHASWFKALADATRIQIVSLSARRRAPMSVGEIVVASGVGQSTVSHHLKILAAVRFVLVERQGTASLYRINERCVSRFPTAADVVLGKPVPAAPTCERRSVPWHRTRSWRGLDDRPGGQARRRAGPGDPADARIRRRPGAGRLPGGPGHRAGRLRGRRALLSAFIAAGEDAGVWTIQSGAFPENAGTSMDWAAATRSYTLSLRAGIAAWAAQ